MSTITNRSALLPHGMVDLRRVAIAVAEAGLDAIDPVRAVEDHVTLEDNILLVGRRPYDLAEVDRILVVGVGKASLRITQTIEHILGDRVTDGVVVVPDGQNASLCRVRLVRSDHPVPTARSVRAGRTLMKLAASAGVNDLMIACVTGGSSSLASLPPAGVTPEEKALLHRLLLASGADITQINSVRKHVSQIKGGRLAELAAPARIVNLTVSDVVGDPHDCVTDLTVQDTSTVKDAVSVLQTHQLWSEVPSSIRDHLLNTAEAVSPDLADLDIHTLMVVTGDSACRAMATRAKKLGYQPVILSTSLEGEAREVGSVLSGVAQECFRRGRPFLPPCCLVGCGGEVTVTLGGGVLGAGGPNQELILGAALRLAPEEPIAVLSLDTDGSDGGTDHAGAIGDGLTRSRAAAARLDLNAALLRHEAAHTLGALGDLIYTGPTYTNVNDLFAVVVGAR